MVITPTITCPRIRLFKHALSYAATNEVASGKQFEPMIANDAKIDQCAASASPDPDPRCTRGVTKIGPVILSVATFN